MENFSFYVIDGLDDKIKENKKIPEIVKDAKLFAKERKWQANLRTIYDGLNGSCDWNTKFKNRRNYQKIKIK